MDNRYYENVIKEMQPFLQENGFTENGDAFYSETKSVSVKYNDEKQMYVLSCADIEDGTVGEYKDINSWLFDDSQNAKDASAVGLDFTNSLRQELGIKHKRKVSENGIDLPSASKSGSMTISGFTKKMLDIFPALKDEYKSHVAHYGTFLYLDFYGEHLVPRVKRLFEEGTNKQIKKFYDVIGDSYVKGDRETVNISVALLSAAAYNNEKVDTAIIEMLEKDKHFLSSYKAFNATFAKNKKLVAALAKEQ